MSGFDVVSHRARAGNSTKSASPVSLRRRVRVSAAALLSACLAGSAPSQASPPPFPQPWIDASHGAEPQTQIQHYDSDTFVIRQSIATNAEGPFIYLFFGSQRVLEIDTGAGGLEIRPAVDKAIAEWRRAKGVARIELVVAHSHSHGDHIAGDAEFAGRPDTVVVGHSPQEVAAFFKIASWPTQIVAFDLGGRVVDIIPSPGHEPAEISLFDRRTRLLMTGDELYPGRLYVPLNEYETYRRTIARIVDFTRDKNVSWVVGCHIEMNRTPGRDYAIHAPSHPLEHPLELPYASLLELNSALQAMGPQPRLEVHNDFIIYPLP